MLLQGILMNKLSWLNYARGWNPRWTNYYYESTPVLRIPILEVSRKYNIDIKVVRLYIKKFKQSLKLRKRANIKYLGKKKKLKEEHKETIKELINNKVNWILTLDEMRTDYWNCILRLRVCRRLLQCSAKKRPLCKKSEPLCKKKKRPPVQKKMS